MAKRTRSLAAKPMSELPDEVKKFFFGGDSVLSKEQLLERNVDFMRRCADGKLGKGESIRGGPWLKSLSKERAKMLLTLIFKNEDWSEKTDPSGTHGNGVVMFDGNYVMWTIREVDLTPPGLLMAEAPREVCLLIKHSSEI